MTTNPLLQMTDQKRAHYGVEALELHVQELNNSSWVADSGKPYFVGQRTNSRGVIEHFVGRTI